MPARLLLALATLATVATAAFAQHPETREEELRRERQTKAANLTPPQPTGLERVLTWLDDGRAFERILNPPEGFYPKIGSVSTGSGFSLGGAYRRPGLFGKRAVLSTFAMRSFDDYWIVDAALSLPELARGKAFVELDAQRYQFPHEDFFGLGPDSRRQDQATFSIGSTVLSATGGVRPFPWLSIGGRIDRLTPEVGYADESDYPSIAALFDPSQIPGLAEQPDFLHYEVFADVDFRQPRGTPRRGGRYYVGYQRFDDRDLHRYNFGRFEADAQHYFPFLNERRVIALRAFASVSAADRGQDIPFYVQRTLGGPDDLRGFRRFRFRDRNILLLQAEYRWEIFTAVDGAVFYDAGKATSDREDLDLRDLGTDYGIGFRFGTDNGVFLRIEGAFGSRDGKHFILRFGNVF